MCGHSERPLSLLINVVLGVLKCSTVTMKACDSVSGDRWWRPSVSKMPLKAPFNSRHPFSTQAPRPPPSRKDCQIGGSCLWCARATDRGLQRQAWQSTDRTGDVMLPGFGVARGIDRNSGTASEVEVCLGIWSLPSRRTSWRRCRKSRPKNACQHLNEQSRTFTANPYNLLFKT